MMKIFKKDNAAFRAEIGRLLTAMVSNRVRSRLPLKFEPGPSYLGNYYDPKKYMTYGGYVSVHHVQAVIVQKGKRRRVHAVATGTHTESWRLRSLLRWQTKDEAFFKRNGKGWRAVDPRIMLEMIPYDNLTRPRLLAWQRRAVAGVKVKPFVCMWDNKEVTILPPVVKRDNDRRLHAEKGAALRWSPDMKRQHTSRMNPVYAWHGTVVDPRIITEEPTQGRISHEWNTEQRRVLIERRYGSMAGFVAAEQLVPSHSDETGDLFHINAGNRNLAYVRVKDPSTDREYWLRVPTNMERARQAVAWTYHLREDEYKPLAEA